MTCGNSSSSRSTAPSATKRPAAPCPIDTSAIARHAGPCEKDPRVPHRRGIRANQLPCPAHSDRGPLRLRHHPGGDPCDRGGQRYRGCYLARRPGDRRCWSSGSARPPTTAPARRPGCASSGRPTSGRSAARRRPRPRPTWARPCPAAEDRRAASSRARPAAAGAAASEARAPARAAQATAPAAPSPWCAASAAGQFRHFDLAALHWSSAATFVQRGTGPRCRRVAGGPGCCGNVLCPAHRTGPLPQRLETP